MPTSFFIHRVLPHGLPGAGAVALLLATGSAVAATPAATAPVAGKSADVQVAQASPSAATTAPQRAAAPLKRNAQGQIESLETRNWAAIDKNGDNLISPDEMQAYLDANKR